MEGCPCPLCLQGTQFPHPHLQLLEPLLLSKSVISNSFKTPWTLASQAPLSKGFPRQEYWSGLPFPPPGDLPFPRPGFNPSSNWGHMCGRVRSDFPLGSSQGPK